jgi:hypothetical protein
MEVPMTALLKSQTTGVVDAQANVQTDALAGAYSLFHGDGVELYSSGSAPQMRNSWTGEGTMLFSSGSAPQARPRARGDQSEGALVELFSSGSAPTTAAGVETGDCVGLFSSGS